MVENIIEVENLIKRYRKSKTNAVDDISFSVKKGEFFALLGPNGAGKTTTISILSTTLSKTSGGVKVAGLDLDSKASEIRKRLGIIFQSPSLDFNLSAEENIRFHAVLYGLYPYRPLYSLMPQEYRDQVEGLAGVLGIAGELKKPVGSFSGGMKRKLEIVRSLMHSPDVLILDEPTTGLDPISRKNLWDYLRQVRKKNDMTILLTTHYLEEAEEADNVYIINDGRIVAHGTPSELKQKLTQEYVIFVTSEEKKLEQELEAKRLDFAYDDGEFRVRMEGHDIVRLIRSLKSPISHFSLHSPSLEEAYFSIIEGEET